MIEIFKFEVGADYGTGLMGALVSEMLRHEYLSFKASKPGKKAEIIITCKNHDGSDNESVNIHEV